MSISSLVAISMRRTRRLSKRPLDAAARNLSRGRTGATPSDPRALRREGVEGDTRKKRVKSVRKAGAGGVVVAERERSRDRKAGAEGGRARIASPSAAIAKSRRMAGERTSENLRIATKRKKRSADSSSRLDRSTGWVRFPSP